YQGALLALDPMLEHRPALQRAVRAGLKKARAEPTAGQQAFALRAVLDELLRTLPKPLPPLWERLGGEKAVRAVVRDFLGRAAKDPKVSFDRGGAFPLDARAVAALEQRLVELVSAFGGGPLAYKGRDMKAAHAGMGITDAEFDALAGHLAASLKAF